MVESSPRKISVCHISTAHEDDSVRVFCKECRSLARAGFDVHYVACSTHDRVVDGVHILALPMPPTRLKGIVVWPWLAYERVLKLRPRPAICHFHDPELLPMGMGLRLRGFRVIYDVHENWPDKAARFARVPAFARGLVAGLYRMAEGILTSGMATVHVLPSIARHYRPPREVVRNLPPLEPVQPAPRKACQRVRLIYVGNISPERGGRSMLRAAQELARRGVPFEMRLVGPIHPPPLELEIRQAIEDSGLSDRVTFTAKRIPLAASLAEVAASDIGLCLLDPLPNYLNSLATKVFEYMRFGLAVVASDFEAWRPHITGVRCGLQVDPANVPAIADAIQWLIEHPDERRQMGLRGQKAVQEEYSWDAEQKKLVAFYGFLLGRRRHHSRK